LNYARIGRQKTEDSFKIHCIAQIMRTFYLIITKLSYFRLPSSVFRLPIRSLRINF